MTASPGFQFRTAEPTRSTTPDASLPITWNGWSWRAPHTLSLPRRFRNPNVGSGSKIDVHTVLKLIELAITATHRLVGRDLGERELLHVDRRARVLLLRRHAREHLLLVGPHQGAAHGFGQRERGQLVAGGAFEDSGADGIDLGRHGRGR